MAVRDPVASAQRTFHKDPVGVSEPSTGWQDNRGTEHYRQRRFHSRQQPERYQSQSAKPFGRTANI